jgi:branched-chain amino acid transport system permease protein
MSTTRAGATGAVYRFKPYNVGRWVVWGGYALIMLVAPLLFKSSLSLTMLSQIGIAIIACLAFNMLLGHGGMLSFGHAVYSGLGSFFAIHALNMVSQGGLSLPVSMIPLVAGFFGMLFAILLGYVTTKKVCHDYPRRGRAGGCHGLDVPGLLWWRRWHQR